MVLPASRSAALAPKFQEFLVTSSATRTRRLFVAATALSCLGLLAAASTAQAHPISAQSGRPASTDAKASVMKGVVVDSNTHNPVRGVIVTARDIGTLDVLGSDVTNASGVYKIGGLTEDEYAVKFNGSRRGYETGFLGCGHGVVPDFGDACTFAPMDLGHARLDHL